jgi:hypothetical protein
MKYAVAVLVVVEDAADEDSAIEIVADLLKYQSIYDYSFSRVVPVAEDKS